MRPALPIAILLVGLGCQPAHRFPSPEKKATPTAVAKPRPSQPTLATLSSWLAPTEAIDFDPPIRFVAREPGREKRWEALPAFWNKFPPPGAGPATLHFGLDPLGAALAVALGGEMDAIEIKVPRHLGPIPIDPNNPPSLDRWRLGRKIFFEPALVQGARTLSCAECHRPDRGFSDGIPPPVIDGRRTISLIDVAVRTPLFWDGRVENLEETLVPADPTNGRLQNAHRWEGVADRLNQDEWYRIEFRRLMGIQRVSEDAVAKVLATYLRTILAGDSLVDRAAVPHSATSFAAILDDTEVRRLSRIAGVDPPLPKETI
ncbi:MAG TPA: cytochrome-c peroxidase, partial [Gemmataceae bacterium]|nr:cytochrome-c peroxidase [Gemmataceae bacterium]